MKNFFLAVLIVFSLAACSLAWNSGSGTESDPYVIAGESDFSYFRYRINNGLDADGSYYVLSNDLQLSSMTRSAPVGLEAQPFTGHFDGSNHTIYVKILPLEDDNPELLSFDRALFGYVYTDGGYAIKNLHVGGYVGGYLPGGVVSTLIDGKIEGCTFSGDVEAVTVTGDEETELHKIHAGGIVADMWGGEIVNCEFAGNVTSEGEAFFSYAGGLVGAMAAGTITGSTVKHYSDITAAGEESSGLAKAAGGLVGFLEVEDLSSNNDGATITGCTFGGGTISSDYSAGGLTGIAYGGIIENCVVADDTRIIGAVLAGGAAGTIGAGGKLSSNDVKGGIVEASSRAAGGIVGLLELGKVESNDSRAAVRGSATYQGGVIGEIHNHYGSSSNVKGNTYSGSAYGIGIDEHMRKNQDTGCEKYNDMTFYFITQSVLDDALEMTKYSNQIDISLPVNLDLSPIPSWLSPYQNESTIYLSGIPATPGKYSFTLTGSYGEQTVSKTFTVNVASQLEINGIDEAEFESGSDIAIAFTIDAVSADLSNASFTWSVTDGDFPSTLEIDSETGAITGYVDDAGTYTFVVQASPENVSLSPVTKTITITITGEVITATILTDYLPNAVVREAYSFTLSCDVPSGYTPFWDIINGSLAYGLTFSTGGTITGTPLQDGVFAFTVSLTADRTVSKDFSLTVTSVDMTVKILTESLPAAGVNTNYSYALEGETPSGYSPVWTLTNGDLPSGFTLSSDGTISGTTSTAGVYPFTVTLTAGAAASKDLTLAVSYNPVPSNPVEIKTSSLPNGTIGKAYTANLVAIPSTASWSISGGILPPGLEFSADGTISGTPTVTGDFSFYATASMSSYSPSTKDYTISIVNQSESELSTKSSGGGGGGCNSFSAVLSAMCLLFCYNVRKSL